MQQENPTNTNALRLKKVPNELANIYLKEQTEYIKYIKNQINGSGNLLKATRIYMICKHTFIYI